jgi:hypothetical protein
VIRFCSGTQILLEISPPITQENYVSAPKPIAVNNGSTELEKKDQNATAEKSKIGNVNVTQGKGMRSSSPPVSKKIKTSKPRGRLAAHVMATVGDLDSLRKLHRTQPEKMLAANKFGETVAHVAVRCGHLYIIRFLRTELPMLFDMENKYGKLPLQNLSRIQQDMVIHLQRAYLVFQDTSTH